MTIRSATPWPTNGQLIADVASLHIRDTDLVVDLTWGKGQWWKNYTPPGGLVSCIWADDPDLLIRLKDNPTLVTILDFGNTQMPDDYADVVCFDPPYVAMGGRDTSGHAEFMNAYGLYAAAATPVLMHLNNLRGAVEAVRICKPGGLILWKTKNYVSSGELHMQTMWTWRDALKMGLEVHDEFRHVGHTLGQPPGRRQVHARQNSSTLFVLRKPRR